MPADYYSKTLLASQVSRAGRGLGATQAGAAELFLGANESLNKPCSGAAVIFQ